MKKIILATAVLTMLSGCAAIDKQITSKETLQKKASQALGVTADTIEISNIEGNFGQVDFNATVNNTVYQCYYTTGVAVKSDAICNTKNGESVDNSCNALLSAAGKC
jgi:uncharacterized protein YcfL